MMALKAQGVTIILVITTLVLITLTFPNTIKPFKVLRTPNSYIQYFNLAMITNESVLIIKPYLKSSAANATVSLFAFTPRGIYTIGYFTGYGSIAVDLDNPLIVNISRYWYEHYGDALWPSFIAIITYDNGSNEESIFTTIPYPPDYLAEEKPLEIIDIVNLTNAGINIKLSQAHGEFTNKAISGSSPQIYASPGSGNYGYTYVGTCTTNHYPVPGSGWVLEGCWEYQGPIAQFFIGWSESALTKSGIDYMGFFDVNGEIESGSGFYGVVNKTVTSTGYSFLQLVGPILEFNENMNVKLANDWWFAEVMPDTSLAPGQHKETTGSLGEYQGVMYYVNGPGFLYLYFDGYIAVVSFYQLSTGIWANGTYVLGLVSDSYNGGNTLYLLPGIDMGNGPVSGMFAGAFESGSITSGEYPLLTDGSYFTSSRGSYQQCNIAPTEVTPDLVQYLFSDVISSYSPNPPGIVFLIGGVIYAAGTAPLPQPWSSIASIAGVFSGLLTPSLTQSTTFYTNAYAGVGIVPNIQYNFYTTFIDSYTYNPNIGEYYYWPMGMIVNYSSFYLYNVLGYRCNG